MAGTRAKWAGGPSDQELQALVGGTYCRFLPRSEVPLGLGVGGRRNPRLDGILRVRMG